MSYFFAVINSNQAFIMVAIIFLFLLLYFALSKLNIDFEGDFSGPIIKIKVDNKEKPKSDSLTSNVSKSKPIVKKIGLYEEDIGDKRTQEEVL